MRIAIFYRYFYPDTPPYATMLRDISGWLADAGHEVTMFTAQPSYKRSAGIPRQPWRERIGNVTVVRLPLLPERGAGPLRLANGALFVVLSAIMLLFSRRFDLVWTATMPPIMQAYVLCRIARLRGAAFLYHMQDIYPEIARAMGAMRNERLARFLTSLDNATLGRAEAVVVLSEDMKSALRERGHRRDNVAIINNYAFSATEDKSEVRAARSGALPLRFVFAGNIGRFQHLPALVDAFGRLGGKLVELELLGDGRIKSELEKQVHTRGYGNVRFHGHVDADAAFAFVRDCDVAVVSLRPGLYRYAFPSKTLTYLAAGLPILALVEPESALGRMIEDRGTGRVVSWDASEEDLAAAIRAMCAAPPLLVDTEASSDIHGASAARTRWVELIAGIAGREKKRAS